MKLKLQLAAVLIVICTANTKAAVLTEVPEVVEKAFKAQYKEATNVKWEKRGAEYEAEFTRDGKSYEASYKANGEWRETGTILNKKDIPVAIVTSFTTLYPNAKMEQVVYIEKGVSGTVYEIEYQKKSIVEEVYMKPDGDRVPDFSEEEEEKYNKE